ncbi:MAG TPA: ATP-binding protein [Iamia sp.]|nr:ATP-binding protein [Iamia sp.]
MSTTATLLQLAAELTLFVVVVAGAGLSVRAGLLGLDRPARLLLSAGFLVLAAVSFAVGSLTIVRTDAPVALAAVRCAGTSIVALGALRWAGSRVGRPTLLAGLAALVVAAVVEARGVDLVWADVGAEPLVLVAALVIGAALVVAGRHTIPGRIGTSVAGVLLAVVLLVSFSVSAVISRTVEDEALRRYGDRVEAEAAAALAEADLSLQEATLVGAGLSASLGGDLAVATDAAAAPADRDAARTRVTAGVAELADGLAIEAPIVVVGPEGPVTVHPTDLASATALSLAGDPVVQEAMEVEGPRQGVTAVGPDAFALAAVPTRGGRGTETVATGVVVVARPLDDAYLEGRIASDREPLSLALVTRDEVAATSGGEGPPEPTVVRPGRDTIDTGVDAGRFAGDRVVVTSVVAAVDVPPQLALVLSTPSDRVVRTREDLYRSLFLVAMLAGLVGIALSVLLGERIGGGIRTLTAAASRIREGDLTARAAVDREDELGELSSTFDAMAVALHHLTDDLRVAAAEEGRLRARLESVFAGVTEAVVAADATGRVTDLNRAAAELLGLAAPEDAEGRALREVVDLAGPDGRPLTLSAPDDRARVIAGRLRPAGGGDPIPVLGTVAALPGGPDEGRAGVVVVLRDIRAEEALEAAKQDFLATIGHELRTPLTPIKGYAGLLRRRTPSPDQAQSWADGITAGVDRLEHMVDRLVTFAAVTAGAGTAVAHHEEVDVGALVTEAGEVWAARLAGDREVVVDVAADLPPVRGDEVQLRLALGELVDNAARFATPGTPVTVSARLAADAPDLVALAVADGGGSGTALLSDVVGAFQQGEAAATRAHEGLGLGLALTERVARAHGGRLGIDASPGGTVVSILVPVVMAAVPQRAEPEDTTRSPEDDG